MAETLTPEVKSAKLQEGEKVPVEYEFDWQMCMFRGKVIVEG